MDKNSKIYVAGHRGLVGSAIVAELRAQGYDNLVLLTHYQLDLRQREDVGHFFSKEAPEYTILAAAQVGGIAAHLKYPVDFLLDNLRIQNNVIEGSHAFGVKKLLFLGSACIYPKRAAIPTPETELLAGPLEPSNEGYAIAKIAGLKLCQAFQKQFGKQFITAMPTNLYGPGDNYNLETSHVLPGMIHRIHLAEKNKQESVRLWGSGSPTREFLHSTDLARACITLMQDYTGTEPVNVGVGSSLSLFDLAAIVAEVVGYRGTIGWDKTKPDGTPFRQLDSSKIFEMGWSPTVGLRDGIRQAYQDFLNRYE